MKKILLAFTVFLFPISTFVFSRSFERLPFDLDIKLTAKGCGERESLEVKDLSVVAPTRTSNGSRFVSDTPGKGRYASQEEELNGSTADLTISISDKNTVEVTALVCAYPNDSDIGECSMLSQKLNTESLKKNVIAKTSCDDTQFSDDGQRKIPVNFSLQLVSTQKN